MLNNKTIQELKAMLEDAYDKEKDIVMRYAVTDHSTLEVKGKLIDVNTFDDIEATISVEGRLHELYVALNEMETVEYDEDAHLWSLKNGNGEIDLGLVV